MLSSQASSLLGVDSMDVQSSLQGTLQPDPSLVGQPSVAASEQFAQEPASGAGGPAAAAPPPPPPPPPSTPAAPLPAHPALGRRRVEVQRVLSARPRAASGPTRGQPLGPQQGQQGQQAAEAPPRVDATTGVEKGGGQERRDWVGHLVRGLWPYARDAAQKFAWDTVPQQLEASRPAFVYELRLEHFTLGDAMPDIRDIRVHSGSGGGGVEELFVEFELEWRSQQDVSLLITVPRLPVAVDEVTPEPLKEALRLLLNLRVSLCDAWVRAGVRVTLRPLLHRLPVVGAVQVSLTRTPDFGYELQLSKLSVHLVPLLREWLDAAIRDLVLQPWVLPEHAFLPLEPLAPDVERPAGVLAVRVLGADNVPRAGLLGGAPRPMLELYVRDSQRRQTAAAPAGTTAAWDACFEFPVSVPEHQELTAILYDYQDFAPNDELGRATLPLRDLEPGQALQLALEARPRAETAREEEEQRMGAGDRALLALGAPFTRKKEGEARCTLRLQVTYLPLSEEEVARVMEQQALPPPERGLRHAFHPAVLRLLRSGLLVVALQRAEGVLAGLGLGAALFKPHFKAVVRVGEAQAESDASKASRQGAVEFSRPIMLHLGEEVVAGGPGATAQLGLLAHSWGRGARACGWLQLLLGELLRGGKLDGEQRLESGGGGGSGIRVQLTAHFRPFF